MGRNFLAACSADVWRFFRADDTLSSPEGFCETISLKHTRKHILQQRTVVTEKQKKKNTTPTRILSLSKKSSSCSRCSKPTKERGLTRDYADKPRLGRRGPTASLRKVGRVCPKRHGSIRKTRTFRTCMTACHSNFRRLSVLRSTPEFS